MHKSVSRMNVMVFNKYLYVPCTSADLIFNTIIKKKYREL